MREEKNQKSILQGPLLADILVKYVFELRKKHVISAGKKKFNCKTDTLILIIRQRLDKHTITK